MTRVPSRWQLEQWQQCRGVHTQSEQYADQYEHQHWFPCRQELRLWYQVLTRYLQEWPQITVVAIVQQEDLPFGLSQPTYLLNGILAKYNSFGWILAVAGFRPERA